jgi:hypothetical protein
MSTMTVINRAVYANFNKAKRKRSVNHAKRYKGFSVCAKGKKKR